MMKIKIQFLFRPPKVRIIDEAVYPKQKPLKQIVKYTTKIPITVDPINHNKIAKIRFFFIELNSKVISFTEFSSFKLFIKDEM